MFNRKIPSSAAATSPLQSSVSAKSANHIEGAVGQSRPTHPAPGVFERVCAAIGGRMKKRSAAGVLVLATSIMPMASVHAEPLTREQVRIELDQAKAAGLVRYGEQEYPAPIVSTQSKSRAQVQDELQRAKSAGQVTFDEMSYPPDASGKSGKSREQVTQELRDAKAAALVTSGELDYPPRAGN